MKETVIIYDGFCVLCNGITKFLLKTDKKNKLKFSALDSKFVEDLKANNLNFPDNIDSIICLKNNQFFIKMDAVIAIAKTLGGAYSIAYVLKAIPRNWRNDFYDYIARNRYKWFGKHDSCQMPDQKYNSRILD